MERHVGGRLTVVMPVGPGSRIEFVEDSLHSVRHFVPDSRLVVMDDTGEGLCDRLRGWPGTTVIDTPRQGYLGGLYLTLSRGFEEALLEPFDVLMKIDTDALVAGPRFVEVASEMFRSNPRLGELGVHTTWYDGSPLRPGAARHSITKAMRPRAALAAPRRAISAAVLCGRVLGRRKPLGGCVFGGVCLFSRAGVEGLSRAGYLSNLRLAALDILEDHLFGTLLVSAGFDLDDLVDGTRSLMGAAWKTLPASPDELIASGRELIHSVRSWEDMDEEEIRRTFATARRQPDRP